MSRNTTRPSAAELQILKILWKSSPLSAKEVHELLSDSSDSSYSTTRTVLDRMVEKRYLAVSKSHGIRVFTSKLNKLDTLARYIREFSRQILGMKSSLPASCFVQSDLLDEEEIKDLNKLLEKELDD